MFYAKGLNLGIKMIAAAPVMTATVVAGGALGLSSLSQIMDSIQATHASIQGKPGLAATLQMHLDKTEAVYRRYRLVMIVGVLAAVIVPIAIAIYFVRTVSDPLSRLVGAMQRVSEGVVTASSVKRSMEAVYASSTKIADMIGVVDESAFQTNLLALNAAVEVARAGEQGRKASSKASRTPPRSAPPPRNRPPASSRSTAPSCRGMALPSPTPRRLKRCREPASRWPPGPYA